MPPALDSETTSDPFVITFIFCGMPCGVLQQVSPRARIAMDG